MKKTTKNTSLISPSKSIPLTILHTTLIIIINRSYILGFVKQLVMIGAGVKEDELQVIIIIIIFFVFIFFIIVIINIIIFILIIVVIIIKNNLTKVYS